MTVCESEGCQRQRPGMATMFDASTAHLSKSDQAKLDELADCTRHSLPIVCDHETGWVVFTSPYTDLRENTEGFGFTPGVVDLIVRAAESGAMLINFHSLGEEMDGIATYE